MAGVDGDSGRYLTADRYNGTNSYPPVMSYSTSSPSYSPYDPTPGVLREWEWRWEYVCRIDVLNAE